MSCLADTVCTDGHTSSPIQCTNCSAALNPKSGVIIGTPVGFPESASVVLRPSRHTPASTTAQYWRADAVLHIGITNAEGSTVYHFNSSGTVAEPAISWGPRCISLKVIRFDANWNARLLKHRTRWQERYDAVSCNCFDYVAAAMNVLRVGSRTHWEKRSLCDHGHGLAEAVAAAEQYDALLLNILTHGPATHQQSAVSCFVSHHGDAAGREFTRGQCSICRDYKSWEALVTEKFGQRVFQQVSANDDWSSPPDVWQ